MKRLEKEERRIPITDWIVWKNEKYAFIDNNTSRNNIKKRIDAACE